MRKLITIILLLLPLSIFAQTNDENKFKLQMAENAILNLYVDTVNESKLVEYAIRGMLKELDPHSSYTTVDETKKVTEPLEGSFEGIGVQFNIVQDTLLVLQTINDGPSEKVGILPGDRIVTVNDSAIAGVKMAREDIMKRLRGKKGTQVKLGIVRRGINENIYFNVTRDKIPLNTIDAYYMAAPGVGYIQLSSFGATSHDEFREAVKELKAQGMNDLILDLQDNGGGYLQASVQLADEFLSRGDLIVYTEGRSVPRSEYSAHGGGLMETGKVVVLINEYSASAAEILSGALQDHDRATIVGRRSFGKGLVQRPLVFPDGSMMRLTVAHYYTPSGRCIQKPYEKGEGEDYAHDIEKRFKHGELYCADSIKFDEKLRCTTLRKNRTVYGGGGIMPDVFVPLDTTQYTALHRKMAAKSIIINKVLSYVDDNRKKLKSSYPDFNKFMKDFTLPEKLVNDIFAEAEKEKIKVETDERERTLPLLRTQLTALIARNIWGMKEYFSIINPTNHIYKKALETIQEQDGI